MISRQKGYMGSAAGFGTGFGAGAGLGVGLGAALVVRVVPGPGWGREPDRGRAVAGSRTAPVGFSFVPN